MNTGSLIFKKKVFLRLFSKKKKKKIMKAYSIKNNKYYVLYFLIL